MPPTVEQPTLYPSQEQIVQAISQLLEAMPREDLQVLLLETVRLSIHRANVIRNLLEIQQASQIFNH